MNFNKLKLYLILKIKPFTIYSTHEANDIKRGEM